MYNGIGLQTARGSGTNGYIQTNKFFIKPKTNKLTSKSYETGQGSGGVSRGPNKEILEHDRKRQIHLKLAVLEDKLIDQGYTDDEIAFKLDEVRKTLEAAMASEDAGGATAVVLNPDHKYSDTQTHQLAARKEKQMENLKNAFGIVHEDDLKKYLPLSDDEKIDDCDKAGNTKKTDRGFSGKLEKDTKAGKDGVDHLKQYKKKTNKRRGSSSSDSSDSDSDSSRENVKVSKKKQQKSRGRSDTESDSGSDSESDFDVDIRNNRQKSSSKHSKSKRHDNDDSRDTKKHGRTVKRYRSESDGNSSSDESPDIKSKKGKQLSSKSRRHDSDDDSDSDASPVDKYGKRQMEDKRKEKRMESKVEKDMSTRNDYGRGISDRWDGGSSKRDVPRDTSPVRGRTHEKDTLGRIGRRRHDTDDEESDEDMHRKKEEVGRGGRRRHVRDPEVIDKNDIRLKEREAVRGGRNEYSNRKDIKSGEKRHIEERKTERVESGGRRRHDSDDDDDDDIDVRRRRDNVERDGRRRHEVDLEPLDKNVRTGEKRQRDIEEHKKERVEGIGRRHDSDDDDDIDARRTKQKVERDGRRQHDDREELNNKEIRTGGSRQSGIEENKKERVESAGRRRHDSDDGDSDMDNKHTKVDRGGKRQEDVNYEKTTKIPTRDEQRHRSKTSDDEDEKYLEGRKENRDEDRRGRKHKRDEDDEKHKKPEKGRELRESKYSREHDEEPESRRGDRDRYADNSKRTRYDSERRYDGGRSRH